MLDSGVYRALVVATDYLLLNVLWLLCCLPAVTAPAATAAMFEVIRSRHRGEEHGGVVRGFLTAFRQYGARASAVGGLWCLLGLVLVADLVISRRMGGTGGLVLLVVFCSVALVYAMGSAALFPTLVSFEARWHAIIRNATLIGLLFPARSIASILLVAGVTLTVVTLPITLVIAGSVTAAAVYHLFRGAFTTLADRQAAAAPRRAETASTPE